MRKLFDPCYRLTPAMWGFIGASFIAWATCMVSVVSHSLHSGKTAVADTAKWPIWSLIILLCGELLLPSLRSLGPVKDRTTLRNLRLIFLGAVALISIAFFSPYGAWALVTLDASVALGIAFRSRQWSLHLDRQAQAVPHPCGGVLDSAPDP